MHENEIRNCYTQYLWVWDGIVELQLPLKIFISTAFRLLICNIWNDSVHPCYDINHIMIAHVYFWTECHSLSYITHTALAFP